jgi:hypothetical protein
MVLYPAYIVPETVSRTVKRPASPATAVLAALVTAVGVAATAYGALTHTAMLIAPGSVLTLAGSAWLGFALACFDVRLYPTHAPAQREP